MSQMCRTHAYEAQRRGARVNVHELWALLELIEQRAPAVILDVGSDPALLWTWWVTGARVVAVSRAGAGPNPAGPLPEAVTVLDGDPLDRSTVLRAGDQLAGGRADMAILGGLLHEGEAMATFDAYEPLVRPGGLLIVHGIDTVPGVRRFWLSLGANAAEELVGGQDPIGYGIVKIQERAHHG